MRLRKPNAVWMAALTTVLVLGAIAVVALAVAHGGSVSARAATTGTPTPSADADEVPWVDRPAPKYTPSPVPTATPEFPACSSTDLTARFGHGGAGLGTYYQPIVFTNVGPGACSLSGAAKAVVGIRSDGSEATRASQPYRSGPAPGLLYGAANLQPGDQAETTITMSDECAAHRLNAENIDRLRFVLPDGSAVEVSAGQPLATGCPLGYFDFGVVGGPPPEAGSPLDALQATSDLPTELPAGRTVTYTVTLTNAGHHVVPLDPCPSYQQFIGLAPHVLEFSYDYLNCDAVPDIKPGQAVHYEMRLDVPEKPENAKFSWMLQGTEVGVGSTPTITSG